LIARVSALAPKYFKYKMFSDKALPDALDIGLEAFHP
jgi:hypothetical protein